MTCQDANLPPRILLNWCLSAFLFCREEREIFPPPFSFFLFIHLVHFFPPPPQLLSPGSKPFLSKPLALAKRDRKTGRSMINRGRWRPRLATGDARFLAEEREREGRNRRIWKLIYEAATFLVNRGNVIDGWARLLTCQQPDGRCKLGWVTRSSVLQRYHSSESCCLVEVYYGCIARDIPLPCPFESCDRLEHNFTGHRKFARRSINTLRGTRRSDLIILRFGIKERSILYECNILKNETFFENYEEIILILRIL